MLPIEPERIHDIEKLKELVNDTRLTPEYRLKVQQRIGEVELEKREAEHRMADARHRAEERKRMRELAGLKEAQRHKKKWDVDERSLSYAFRRTWKGLKTRLGPAFGGLLVGYKWLEGEDMVPPIKETLSFLSGVDELYIVILLGAGLVVTYFSVVVMDEVSGEYHRKS